VQSAGTGRETSCSLHENKGESHSKKHLKKPPQKSMGTTTIRAGCWERGEHHSQPRRGRVGHRASNGKLYTEEELNLRSTSHDDA